MELFRSANIDWLGKKWYFLGFSLIFSVAGLISIFFCVQEPGIVNQFENDRKKFDKNIDVYSKVLCQDLNEFKLPCLTPH